jgi:hypothetical protein
VSKINCWELRKCGRNPGGEKVKELGNCPAATDARLNGINGGTNGGRCCWTIAGTFCFGEVQGTFARKIDDCMECKFFWLVADEEEEFAPSVGVRRCYSKT